MSSTRSSPYVTPFLRPATKTHGGKRYLARKILERLPAHRRYVEPFAGGLSVLLNKPPSGPEVAADIHPGLIGFYRTLQDRPAELIACVAPIRYNEATFEWSKDPVDGDAPIESAVRFLVRNRFSRGGLGEDFAWSERLRGGRPGDLNAWETIKAQLPAIAGRLARVDLRCGDAVEVIREFDAPDTLFYLDPPYHPATRTARDAYDFEMTDDQHRRLLDVVAACRGRFAISGYADPLYDEALRGWERVEIEIANHSAQTRSKQRRVEVLWVRTGDVPRARPPAGRRVPSSDAPGVISGPAGAGPILSTSSSTGVDP
jgi:DNA adenine methylase